METYLRNLDVNGACCVYIYVHTYIHT